MHNSYLQCLRSLLSRCNIWTAVCLILQLTTASTQNVAFPADVSATKTTTAAASTMANTKSSISTTTFIANGTSTRSGLGGFSTLDKEVVERLIKQWAPVVWLAPEEKFLPLGVDEFLNHVHPTIKGTAFIPSMPLGDNSMKAYLVTNAEIDELLENENSFIYGRNPNESPVPIYAVVTLCNEQTPDLNRQNGDVVQPDSSLNNPQAPQQQMPLAMTSTRGPYIPVSIDPLEERNELVRRSSRLYPEFKRLRRDLATAEALYNKPSAVPLNIAPPGYELVMGETSPNNDGSKEAISAAVPATASTVVPENNNGPVNNFIANLVDNVKFSVNDDEIDNSINFDSNFNEQGSHQMWPDEQPMVVAPSFHVTYWMFYPYSQGKTICTVSLGPFGSIPFPAVYGFCLGRRKDIGSHIGDWEHMSLYFNGDAEPEAMYVSAHDAGAYYTYNHLTGSFEFKKQETRKGILQRPNFPKTVTTFNNHPVLFAAKGSHGLWTAPGKHRFVKVARLYDINGFGTPWNSWKAVDIAYENLRSYGRSLAPTWLSFKGKWGNPKNKCHPFRRIGLNFCEYSDGPTGIPLKEPHFKCGAPTYR